MTRSDTTKRTHEVLAALAGQVSAARNAARAYLDAWLDLGRDPVGLTEIRLRAHPGCGSWEAINSYYSRLIAAGLLVVLRRRRGRREVALAPDIDGASLRESMGDYERTSRRVSGEVVRTCSGCGNQFGRLPTADICSVCEAVGVNPGLGVRLDYYADRAARGLPLFGPGWNEAGYVRPAWFKRDF